MDTAENQLNTLINEVRDKLKTLIASEDIYFIDVSIKFSTKSTGFIFVLSTKLSDCKVLKSYHPSLDIALIHLKTKIDLYQEEKAAEAYATSQKKKKIAGKIRNFLFPG